MYIIDSFASFINFNSWTENSEPDRAQVVKQVFDACTTVGFLYAKNIGIRYGKFAFQ